MTQADMDLGVSIVNIASVTFAQTGPKTAQATTVVSQRPSFTVTKTADLGVVSSANTTIRYVVKVKNTGTSEMLNFLSCRIVFFLKSHTSCLISKFDLI